MQRNLFAANCDRPDLLTAQVRADDGTLAGIAYGHTWWWSQEDHPWATELADRLGPAADLLEGTTAVCLLALTPEHRGRGLGRALLDRVVGHAPGRLWLITRDEDTVARRLYGRLGWQVVGHGPEAPNGSPGLVLSLPARSAGNDKGSSPAG